MIQIIQKLEARYPDLNWEQLYLEKLRNSAIVSLSGLSVQRLCQPDHFPPEIHNSIFQSLFIHQGKPLLKLATKLKLPQARKSSIHYYGKDGTFHSCSSTQGKTNDGFSFQQIKGLYDSDPWFTYWYHLKQKKLSFP